MLANAQLGVHQDFQVLLCSAPFQLSSPQYILAHGVVTLPVQNFALLFVELHEFPVSSLLQSAEVLLHGNMTFWRISRSSQFCVIGKLAEVVLCPVTKVCFVGVVFQYFRCLQNRCICLN